MLIGLQFLWNVSCRQAHTSAKDKVVKSLHLPVVISKPPPDFDDLPGFETLVLKRQKTQNEKSKSSRDTI